MGMSKPTKSARGASGTVHSVLCSKTAVCTGGGEVFRGLGFRSDVVVGTWREAGARVESKSYILCNVWPAKETEFFL